MALSLLDQFGGSQKQAAANAQTAQQKLAALQARPVAMPGAGSGTFMGDPRWKDYQKNQSAINQAKTEVQNQGLYKAYQDPSKNPTAAFQRILGTSEDFYNQNAGESPMDKMMREQLMQRISGQQQPYDAATIGALKTGANEQAAQAQSVNDQRAQASLQERGFSPGDPGYQAAMARNQLQRQQANQQASLGINQQANLANYNAKGQAIGQASGVTNDQYNRQAGALDRLQKNYNQVTVNDLGTAKRFQVPSYSDYMRNK